MKKTNFYLKEIELSSIAIYRIRRDKKFRNRDEK